MANPKALPTNIPDFVEETIVSRAAIDKRIDELAREIAGDFKPILLPGETIMLVCILKGSYIFTADLARALSRHGVPNTVEFMCVSSYGKETVSSGEVRVLLDMRHPIMNQHVFVVEDIVDSARTMHFLRALLLTRSPKSLKLVTLLDKPVKRAAEVKIDYAGFVIPDKFVIGYGMDYAEQYRNLDAVYALKKSVYMKESHHAVTQSKL
eukprot:PhM_4_TR16477/c0_g1_i2/m.11204/K00760/hprT, hpt, HPRT1; hypoxanthine phosphoribosyltransferase